MKTLTKKAIRLRKEKIDKLASDILDSEDTLTVIDSKKERDTIKKEIELLEKVLELKDLPIAEYRRDLQI